MNDASRAIGIADVFAAKIARGHVLVAADEGGAPLGVVAAVVMLLVGFFFATVSGNLVGMIGSSNNPISGLTLSTLIIAALLMVALGVSGPGGVAVVLGVAAVVCVSSAVAGELLQDFKAGRRTDPHASPMVAQLSTDDMMALGFFFAAQKQLPIQFKVDPSMVEAGRRTSETVLCPMCHLGGFVGQNEIPRVAGQWPQYIKKQLEDFKAKRRTNDGGRNSGVLCRIGVGQVWTCAWSA